MCPNCLGRSTHDIDDLEYKAHKKKHTSRNKSKGDSIDLFDFEFFDVGKSAPEPNQEK